MDKAGIWNVPKHKNEGVCIMGRFGQHYGANYDTTIPTFFKISGKSIAFSGKISGQSISLTKVSGQSIAVKT